MLASYIFFFFFLRDFDDEKGQEKKNLDLGFSLFLFLSLSLQTTTEKNKKTHTNKPGYTTHHCAPITVSIESAIRSLDCRLKLIPSVPIEMPSETPIVLNL